jgi:CheY-like chemotaxis protein
MNLKVLIVDDDDVIIFLHNMVAEDNGLPSKTLGFLNGKEAFEYLNTQNNPDQYYLILLDINMPIMNGWQLLDCIQDSGFAHKVFVAMITSSVDAEDRQKAAQYSQVIGFYEKPLNDDGFNEIMDLPMISPLLNP